MSKKVRNSSSLSKKIRRLERRVMVAWIRFARRHRDSHILPIALFFIIFFDGFVMIIPATVILIAAITISPRRWVLFSILFALAATLNNAATYFIGRHISPQFILNLVSTFHVEILWTEAQEALQQYGPSGAFIGAMIGLPTQMMTALIGMADARSALDSIVPTSTFAHAISMVFVGHTIKCHLIAGLTKFGWVRLEKKFQKDVKDA